MRKNDTQMKKSELLPFHIIKACGNCVPLEQPKTRYYGETQRGYG